MMLSKADGSEELVKVESTFNPERQYLYQCVFYRALNSDAVDLPPLDPVIKNYTSPEVEIYQNTQALMPNVKKEFRLVKKINLAERQAKKQQMIIWKDLI
jgi:hypothetical protein